MPRFGQVEIRARIGLPLLFIGGLVCLAAVYLAVTTSTTWRWLGLVGVALVLIGLDFRPPTRR